MDRFAAIFFGELNDTLTIEVLVCAAEVDGEGRGESMLGESIWVSVEGCGAYAGL